MIKKTLYNHLLSTSFTISSISKVWIRHCFSSIMTQQSATSWFTVSKFHCNPSTLSLLCRHWCHKGISQGNVPSYVAMGIMATGNFANMWNSSSRVTEVTHPQIRRWVRGGWGWIGDVILSGRDAQEVNVFGSGGMMQQTAGQRLFHFLVPYLLLPLQKLICRHEGWRVKKH